MKSVILFLIITFSFLQPSVEKSLFYNALSSESITQLDDMIKQIEKEKTSPLNLAYKGALIAKKASFEKKAADKVKMFKSGIKLLETEINNAPKETEYRFIRLTIQENSPKILKYNKNIDEDITLIVNDYSKLNKGLKKVIFNYSKKSTALNSASLK